MEEWKNGMMEEWKNDRRLKRTFRTREKMQDRTSARPNADHVTTSILKLSSFPYSNIPTFRILWDATVIGTTIETKIGSDNDRDKDRKSTLNAAKSLKYRQANPSH